MVGSAERLPLLLLVAWAGAAQTARTNEGQQVLVVVNRRSPISRQVADYYMRARSVPAGNLCSIDAPPVETISRSVFDTRIDASVAACLRGGLREKILYIVLTSGVPLRIEGPGEAMRSEAASVDSELTLLYRRLRGVKDPLPGPIPNPYFGHPDSPFRHPSFPMYLVTRLDGYDLADIRALVDRPAKARNRGKFVIDLKPRGEVTPGNQWLRDAAVLLPKDRVVIDDTSKVLTGIQDVIGYASWGSNDTNRRQRYLHMKWLPGAIATEFVSFDARTFRPPPPKWEIGTWDDPKSWYAGAPQSLTADYIHEGATGASGQVFEPYLNWCPRPDYVLPAWYAGHILAESFYLGIPGLSWMNVVIGDPLARLAP